jgi:phosphate/sulfate permease
MILGENKFTHALLSTPSPAAELNTQGLADFLRQFFGPLFLVTVSVVALFFLFTREITRFVQFLAIAIVIGVVFYVPNIIEHLARGIAAALGIS